MIKRYLVVLAVTVLIPAAARANSEDIRVYGTFHALLGLHTWGGASVEALENSPQYADLAEPTFHTSTTGGFYLSGLYTRLLAEWMHIGGFFAYQGGELTMHADGLQTATSPRGMRLNYKSRINDVSLGLCAKMAGRMVNDFWFGLELDMGMAFVIADGETLSSGFRLFPRVTFDFLSWKLRDKFITGVSVSVGIVIDAYAAGEVDVVGPDGSKLTTSDFSYSAVRPVLLVGGTFGI